MMCAVSAFPATGHVALSRGGRAKAGMPPERVRIFAIVAAAIGKREDAESARAAGVANLPPVLRIVAAVFLEFDRRA